MIAIAHRGDIDGLRGLAVMLVVLFHFFPEQFPGGFIGVDIFFVISGFLITQIIASDLAKQQFSFGDFYARRIRRLFPALLVVCIAAWIIGWFILFPDEYALLGKHLFASGLLIQNFNAWSEINYFDELTNTKPLLHLWSLGVEGQFYLVWPVLLWLAYQYKIKTFWMITLFGLASFVLNLVLTETNPRLAFFSPQTRAWELLLGAWLGYRSMFQVSPFRYQSIVGMALIGIGVAWINESTAFPGISALLPTFGAFLMIGSKPNTWLNRTILGGKPLRTLGMISYPLYLWHWVLLTFMRISETGEISLEARWVVLLISLGLAGITYRWIEQPLRTASLRLVKTSGLVIGMSVVAFIGLNTYSRDGLAFRAPYQKADTALLGEIQAIRLRIPEKFFDGFTCDVIGSNCQIREKQKKIIFIWGDSHAQMMHYGIEQIAPTDWTTVLVSYPGCHPGIVIMQSQNQDDCMRHNQFATSTIENLKPQIVLLAQRDAWQPLQVEDLYQELNNRGVQKVLYLGKTPEWTAPLPKVIIRKRLDKNEPYIQAGVNQQALALDVLAKQSFIPEPNKHYIDLVGLLCQGPKCRVYLGDQPQAGLTSFDYNHLSPLASIYVADQLIRLYLK